MTKRILVALDGSERSERSIPWLKLLARKADPILLRVIEPVYALDVYALTVEEDVHKEARTYLGRISKDISPAPIQEIRKGPAAPTILDTARELKAGMIAVTTHGGSPLGRRVFGGTTEKLIHGSDLPLLVVPSWQPQVPPARIEKILVPLDGSQTSEAIVPLAVELAQRHDARLVLAHVLTAPEEARKRYADLEGHLRALAGKLNDQWVRTKAVIRPGRAVEEILKLVTEEDVDVIAMSAHGYGAVQRMLFGSVASAVIRESPVPVLVARQEALKSLKLPAVAEARRS